VKVVVGAYAKNLYLFNLILHNSAQIREHLLYSQKV
jgi:hypothetical protein